MTCKEFDEIWDDLLDSRNAGLGVRASNSTLPASPAQPSDLLQSLRGHATECPECRLRLPARETLWQAIAVWSAGPKASPSDGLADRILAAISEQTELIPARRNGRRWSRAWMAGITATAAAAALAMFSLSRVDHATGSPRAVDPYAARSVERFEPNPTPRAELVALNQALADASEATWDLAHAASAPAVRLGREVFNGRDETSLDADRDRTGTVMKIFSSELPGEVVTKALNQFSEGISAEVGPISNSARRALDYLKGAIQAPGDEAETPTTAKPDPKGA